MSDFRQYKFNSPDLHPPPPPQHTHTLTHARTHARTTHARTHTHTHTHTHNRMVYRTLGVGLPGESTPIAATTTTTTTTTTTKVFKNAENVRIEARDGARHCDLCIGTYNPPDTLATEPCENGVFVTHGPPSGANTDRSTCFFFYFLLLYPVFVLSQSTLQKIKPTCRKATCEITSISSDTYNCSAPAKSIS